MNRLALGVAALVAAAMPALAGDAGSPAGAFIDAQSTDQYLAKDTLIGAKVVGPDGKIIGDIEDLIVNDANQIVGAVMGTGGVLGLAEKKVGVSLSAFTFEEKDGKTVVSLPQATPETLKAAAAFQRATPAKSLLERAKEKARELSDKTAETSKDAYERSKPAIEQAKEKAQEAYEKAKEAAAKAKEAAGPAIEAAKEAIQGAADKAKEALDEAKPAPEEPPQQ